MLFLSLLLFFSSATASQDAFDDAFQEPVQGTVVPPPQNLQREAVLRGAITVSSAALPPPSLLLHSPLKAADPDVIGSVGKMAAAGAAQGRMPTPHVGWWRASDNEEVAGKLTTAVERSRAADLTLDLLKKNAPKVSNSTVVPPKSASKVEAHSVLVAVARKGETEISVASIAEFEVGTSIVIDAGHAQEEHMTLKSVVKQQSSSSDPVLSMLQSNEGNNSNSSIAAAIPTAGATLAAVPVAAGAEAGVLSLQQPLKQDHVLGTIVHQNLDPPQALDPHRVPTTWSEWSEAMLPPRPWNNDTSKYDMITTTTRAANTGDRELWLLWGNDWPISARVDIEFEGGQREENVVTGVISQKDLTNLIQAGVQDVPSDIIFLKYPLAFKHAVNTRVAKRKSSGKKVSHPQPMLTTSMMDRYMRHNTLQPMALPSGPHDIPPHTELTFPFMSSRPSTDIAMDMEPPRLNFAPLDPSNHYSLPGPGTYSGNRQSGADSFLGYIPAPASRAYQAASTQVMMQPPLPKV